MLRFAATVALGWDPADSIQIPRLLLSRGAGMARSKMSRASSLIVRTRKIVQAQIERFEPSANPNPSSSPEIRVENQDVIVVRETPIPAQVNRWLQSIAEDQGCRTTGGKHLGCGAALELAALRELPSVAVPLLEQVVTQAGRPACLRMAAVGALARSELPYARRALSRMSSVTERRLAFDGRHEDRLLAAALRTATKPGDTLARSNSL